MNKPMTPLQNEVLNATAANDQSNELSGDSGRITIMRAHDLYRYQLTRQKHTDGRYGFCEVCGKPAPVIHHQVEQRRYTRQSEVGHGWTETDCSDSFGHADCLSNLRRFKTNNQEIQTGMTVRTTRSAHHTVIKLGTLTTMDAALIREVKPRFLGHKPDESWLPLQDLHIIR
jgi:hypothetical protein